MNITFMEVELFTIRCGINHVAQLQDVACIIIITDVISAAKQIFNTFIYPYQLYSIAISKDLRCFFNQNSNNSIAFWDCSNSIKWSPHPLVDKESKCLRIDLVLLSKHHRSLVGKNNTILSLKNGKCISKPLNTREEISLN